MDPALKFETEMMARQKPMNDAIEKGDSAVQEFYRDATLFITGGTGFLGKQLTEKLFRSCKLKKIYLLMRSKRGKTMQERLNYALRDPVFDVVRKKLPTFADNIVPVEGDMADLRLGLSDKDWTTIIQEVNIIVHMAATVRFDEPLRLATLINVRGTREILKLARECIQLKSIVTVSTAYSHATYDRIGKEVLEQFYPCPMPPELLIEMAETINEERLNAITPHLIKGWPNTYTFTKALAEEVVRTTGGDLPICIVKPPIVVNSYLEPMPGWLDKSCASSTGGISIGVSLGFIHVVFVDVHKNLALVPVDIVNNNILAAGWASAEERATGDTDIPIYIIANKDSYIPWAYSAHVLRTQSVKFATPKAICYYFMVETRNELVYWFLSWILHYIPAYIVDGLRAVVPVKLEGIPSFVSIYRKLHKMNSVYKYYLTNDWDFNDNKVRRMISKMSYTDKYIFNCDLTTVVREDFVNDWAIGAKKYIIKDGFKGSSAAQRRQKIFCVANYIILAIYLYVFWNILKVFWTIVKYIL